MRKSTLKFFGLVAFSFATLTLTNCGSDDIDPIQPDVSQVIQDLNNGVMKGSLDQDYTLSAGTAYSLPSAFIVQSGAKLTIPAGTKITAAAGGTVFYVFIARYLISPFCDFLA